MNMSEETFKRRGGAHMAFSERAYTIWTELNEYRPTARFSGGRRDS